MAVAVLLLSHSWTGMVLGLSITGSLYQWPFLRGTSMRLLGVTVLASTFVGMLIFLAMNLGNGEFTHKFITTDTELIHTVGTANLTRFAELLEGSKPYEVDAGRLVGPLGVIGSRTPLYEAASNGHTEMVVALLKAGADPNAGNAHGFGTLVSSTPLGAAVMNSNTETVAALLAAGANPNTRVTFAMGMFIWFTPLYYAGLSASRSGSTEIVAALIKAGAEVSARSMAGLGMVLWGTPMDFQVVRGEWFEHTTRGHKVHLVHDLLKRMA